MCERLMCFFLYSIRAGDDLDTSEQHKKGNTLSMNSAPLPFSNLSDNSSLLLDTSSTIFTISLQHLQIGFYRTASC